MVESIGQLISKSCRILASGEQGLGGTPPSLVSSAACVSLEAARAVCRLPVLEAGGRLKCLIEDFPHMFCRRRQSVRLAHLRLQTWLVKRKPIHAQQPLAFVH